MINGNRHFALIKIGDIAKLGGCGLYVAPLSELKLYYSSDNYDVYRTN